MNDGDFVLFGYEFDGKGAGKRLFGEDIVKQVKSKTLAWVHLDATHPETAQWLNDNVSYLDPIIIDALLASETRPRVSFVGKGAKIILRGMNLQENADPEDMISLRLWVDENRIISLQRRPLMAVDDMRRALESGKGPANAAAFLTGLSQFLFERMQPVLTDLSDRLDEIEETMIVESTAEIRHDVNDIRRKSLIFKRYIMPQKDVMISLRNAELDWLSDNDRRRFQENQDRLTRYLEDLDTVRERAQIIKEEYTAALSDRMNRNMYALSIIAGVFLPLGFLTGLMGINVGGMPWVENPLGFWMVAGLCLLSGVGFLALLKWLKWL